MATKAQHYVWRGYLKRWNVENDSKGKVFVYRKHPMGSQPQIEHVKLEKVGFEKYYYDMTGFGQEDISLLTQLISYMEKDELIKLSLNSDLFPEANAKRDFVESIMCTYEDMDNQHNFLEKIVNNDLDFYQDSIPQVIMNELGEEILLRLFGLKKRRDEEIVDAFLDAMLHTQDEDLKHEFHRFLFMQYMRSPVRVGALRERFEEAKKKHHDEIRQVNTGFCINSLMIFSAEKLAFNVSNYFHTWLERYDNQSGIPFLTSDTPVINLTGTRFEGKTEFYYPVSPLIAIKLCLSHKGSEYGNSVNRCIEFHDSKEVGYLNQAIVEQCRNEIFADRKDILDAINNAKFCRDNSNHTFS